MLCDIGDILWTFIAGVITGGLLVFVSMWSGVKLERNTWQSVDTDDDAEEEDSADWWKNA